MINPWSVFIDKGETMKRLIAAIALAAIAVPAAAVEHGGPWSEDETRAPWDQQKIDKKERAAPDAQKGER